MILLRFVLIKSCLLYTSSSLEKGRYNPSILLAFKIARRFEMRIEDVFIYQEEDHEE